MLQAHEGAPLVLVNRGRGVHCQHMGMNRVDEALQSYAQKEQALGLGAECVKRGGSSCNVKDHAQEQAPLQQPARRTPPGQRADGQGPDDTASERLGAQRLAHLNGREAEPVHEQERQPRPRERLRGGAGNLQQDEHQQHGPGHERPQLGDAQKLEWKGHDRRQGQRGPRQGLRRKLQRGALLGTPKHLGGWRRWPCTLVDRRPGRQQQAQCRGEQGHTGCDPRAQVEVSGRGYDATGHGGHAVAKGVGQADAANGAGPLLLGGLLQQQGLGQQEPMLEKGGNPGNEQKLDTCSRRQKCVRERRAGKANHEGQAHAPDVQQQAHGQGTEGVDHRGPRLQRGVPDRSIPLRPHEHLHKVGLNRRLQLEAQRVERHVQIDDCKHPIAAHCALRQLQPWQVVGT
mmetsp:Transcript_82575/g.233934  ORF Transcript_82575/g.233934 Transcript_82575/m.233934 type:complete len:401 (+) Transcript_82575:224-1426(+)